MQGLEFFKDLATREDPATWPHRAAIMLTAGCAETLIEHGRVYPPAIGYALFWILQVADIPLRNQLRDLVVTVDQGGFEDDQARRDAVASKLMSLGSALHLRGSYHSAIETYAVLATSSHVDGEVRLSALQQQAYAWRVLKKFDEAQWAYDHLKHRATVERNNPMQLEAELGHAKVLRERDGVGDLAAAAKIITRVIARARRRQVNAVLAKALQDRSSIAGMLGDYQSAILDANDALRYVSERDQREHIMLNMATAFYALDRRQPSIDLSQCLWDDALELEVRTFAGVMRYNLALDARDERSMLACYERLSAMTMPPEPLAEFHEALARHHALHEEWDAAAAAARQMIAIAREHALNGLVLRGNGAIEDITRHVVPAIFDRRPVAATTAAEQKLAAVENTVAKLCAI